MDVTLRSLADTFDNLACVLESDGAHHWSLRVRSASALLRNGDASGADSFLGEFGGMGSLNDLVLGQTKLNGEFSWKPGYVELNERFESLRTKAWELAQQLKRVSRGKA